MLLDRILSLDLPKEIIVLFISTLPVFELRGALPVGINIYHFPWHYAMLLATIGNMLPVPLLLLFFNATAKLLYRVPALKKPLDWLFARTRREAARVEKYGLIGLLIFVAVPLPLTGAWTASLIATLLGIKPIPAFMSILGGVLIAGVIVVTLSLMGWAGAVIAGLALIGLAVVGILRRPGKPSLS